MSNLLKNLSKVGKFFSRHKQLLSQIDFLQFQVSESQKEIDKLKPYFTWVPPGHFYSPIHSQEEVNEYDKVYKTNCLYLEKHPSGIIINKKNQLRKFKRFIPYLKELPFSEFKGEQTRYFYYNRSFEYFDGIILYCFLRHLQPRNVIEIGSGYSSTLTLDVNELYWGLPR